VIISDALRLDHVAIELRSATNDWTRIAGRGDPCEHDETFPLEWVINSSVGSWSDTAAEVWAGATERY
jgi:hypothetical protein